MTQKKKFANPVLQTDGDPIAVGDTVKLVLRDLSTKDVTATVVADGGRTIGWNLTADGIPRSNDVVAVHGQHQHNYPDYLTQGYDRTDPDVNGLDPVTNSN